MQFYLTMFHDRGSGDYDTMFFATDSGEHVSLKLYDNRVALRFEGDEHILQILPFNTGITVDLYSNNPAGAETCTYYAGEVPQALHLPEMDGIAEKFITWICHADRNGEGVLRQFEVSGGTIYLRPQF